MYLGLINSTVVNPSPVGGVRDKKQHPAAQIQFKKSTVPSYGAYNLNTGSVMEIAPPGTASVSV